MGKRERDRLRSLDAVALSSERRPRKDLDEVAADRGVVLLPERGGASHYATVVSRVLIPTNHQNLRVLGRPYI